MSAQTSARTSAPTSAPPSTPTSAPTATQPAAQTATPASSPLPREAMAERMKACAMCHGREGRATSAGYFPRIAGKPAGYLFNQLQNFREGRRRNTAMNHLMQYMSDDYLREMAAYFSSLDLPYPPARPSGLTAEETRLAETLVYRGAPQRQLPACVSCHGADMTGKLPAMPGLLTLPADYLIGQLGAWQTGSRHARAPDCMATVAQRLTADEVSVLARWLSSQAVPANPHPAPAGAQPLPITCGSGGP
ncbi:cytochrome c [Roseateles depolymerans]|nr:cytochrome c [Roseateles depolymerans]